MQRITLTVLGLASFAMLAGCAKDNCCTSNAPSQERGSSSAAPAGSSHAEATEAKDAAAGARADRAAEGVHKESGVEIRNLSRDGDIWIGGEPTDKGYRQMHDKGVDAIVDLRNPSAKQEESAEQAKKLGVDYVNLPIDPNHMEDGKASAFLDFMKQHQGKQVLIHCGSANRASGMYALYLGAVKKVPTPQAIERAKQAGLREPDLERDVRNYLETKAAPR